MNNYRAWVYVNKINGRPCASFWKPFTSALQARLFMKINGYKLLAKDRDY